MHEPIGYTFRIGVTGHRELDDPDAVKQSVDSALSHLRQLFDEANQRPSTIAREFAHASDRCLARAANSILRLFGFRTGISQNSGNGQKHTPVNWVVISPLAKGADRIVAKCVLAIDGARLQVASPLPLDEYRKDFDTAEDRAEFESLLQLDSAPTQFYNDVDPAFVAQPSDARSSAYLHVGQRVVDSCELLVAVWDGNEADGRGGTADIVQYALARNKPILWINASQPTAPPALLTSSPRGALGHGPQPGMWTKGLPEHIKRLSPGFHRLAAYQRDAGFDAAAAKRQSENLHQQLMAAAEKSGLLRDAIEPVLDDMLPLYTRADQLAKLYQKLYVFGAKWLYRLSAIAVTIAVAQVLFFPHTLWLIAFEIAAMVAALVLLRVGKREAWHEKWLNDRHLAEWLRARIFTVLLGDTQGETHRVARALPFYRGPDTWFVDAYGPIVRRVHKRVPTPLPLKPLKRFLIDNWIATQAVWHQENARCRRRQAHVYHRIGVMLFALTLLMATLHLFGVGHQTHGDADGHVDSTTEPVPRDAVLTAEAPRANQSDAEPGSERRSKQMQTAEPWWWPLLGRLITFLAIVLPAWGAAVHAVGNLLDYDRLGRRSEKMAHLLSVAASSTEDAKTLDELRRKVAKCEEIMASENQEWLVSLSFRPLTLPA